ncbi:MAG TPA: GPP34 family phosphoprotein [Kineosporiaceae bacterium]|nr:GPP34 family phosphoprotein [Kineosporiaceae bacterium]
MTLALADELFLMSHDLQTGKVRLAEPAIGIGLSSALLAELIFSGSLVISQGRILLGDYPPPAERLSEALYEQTRNLVFSQDVTVKDWLASHRKLVLDLVADRMIRAGELHREQQRRFGRTTIRYLPLKASEAFIRTQRLPSFLRNGIELNEQDTTLAGLAALVSPGSGPLELDDGGREQLNQLTARLSSPLHELLAITEAAVLAALRNPHF